MRRFFCYLLVTFLLCCFASNAEAQGDDERGYINLSIYGAGVFPNDDDVDEELYLGGRITYDILDYVEIGVEAGWVEYKVDDGAGIDAGDITGVPILGVIILKYPIEATDDRLVPFAVVGAGVVLWSFDESSLLDVNGISVTGDESFAFKVGGGFDYYLTDNMAVFFEGSYMWSEYDVSISAGGAVVGTTLDTDAMFIGGGLKFSI